MAFKTFIKLFLVMLLVIMTASCAALHERSGLEELSQQGGLDVDLDSNDTMDAAFGGTNRDTSGDTGFMYVTAGVWSAITTVVLEADIDTVQELEDLSNGGAFMSDILAATTADNARSIVGSQEEWISQTATNSVPDDPYVITKVAGENVRILVDPNAADVDIQLLETNANDMDVAVLINVGSETLYMADSSGVTELVAPLVLAQHESITFRYYSDRWIEESRATNAVSFASLTGVPITLDDDVGVNIVGTPDGMVDDSYQGIMLTGIAAGSDIVEFALVVLSSDGKYDEADADGGATLYPARGMAVACSGGDWPCQDTELLTILVRGLVRNDGWPEDWTIGDTLFLDDTDSAGAIDNDAPATATDCVQVIGWAVSTDEVFVDVSTTWVIVP